MTNEDLENKVHSLLKNGKKRTTRDMRSSSKVLGTISPQKLNSILRKMVQDGDLIKINEKDEIFYFSKNALYANAVAMLDEAKEAQEE